MSERRTKSAPGIPSVKLPPTERERKLLEELHARDQALKHLKLQQAQFEGEQQAAESQRTHSVFPRASNPRQRLSLIVAIIAALGGGAGIRHLLQPPDLNHARLEVIHADVKRQTEALTEIRDHLRAEHRRDRVRWRIVETVMCAHNAGKPFARGVDCRAVELEPLPLDAPQVTLPAYRARAEWPFANRPP